MLRETMLLGRAG